MILIINTKTKTITNNDSESLEEFMKEIETVGREISTYDYLRLKSVSELRGSKDFVMIGFDSPKNWTGDYSCENGFYLCTCSKCKAKFYGYKRRTKCKECSSNG